MNTADKIIEDFCNDIADVRDSDFAAVTLSYWCALHMSAAAALHAIAADDRLPELERMLRFALRHRFGGGLA